MFRIMSSCLLVLLTFFSTRTVSESDPSGTHPEIHTTETAWLIKQRYSDFHLQDILPFQAFEQAMLGYYAFDHPKQDVMTIIDFTKPSSEKRMVVLDMEEGRILFHTLVAHGRNSGELYATQFSNTHGSFQSSMGFFRTDHTYQGGNGYSLVIDGLEEGVNDQARARAVVIHGADYCSETFVQQTGRLGRSHGCPALPQELNQAIIDTIKGGSLLYIYAGDENYELSNALFQDSTLWAE